MKTIVENNNIGIEGMTPDQKIQSRASFCHKQQVQKFQNIKKVDAIEKYLSERGIKVPEYKPKKKDYFDCLLDKETGEYQGKYELIIKALLDLKKSGYALFADFKDGEVHKYQFLTLHHTLNKLDSIWNFRKSRMIRKVWRDNLKNEKLWEKFNICHLTLTVPHPNGLFRGKKFYARDLIKEFNFLRKDKEFIEKVFGGEYGIEHAKGNNNGLHLHLHCLVFQYKDFNVNAVRDKIQAIWNKKTGGNAYYESLYVHRKDSQGRWILENKPETIIKKGTEWNHREAKVVRKKFYLSNRYEWYRKLSEEEKVSVWERSIMEVIKYHFKDNTFKDDAENWDVDYMIEILNESKNLRMYSKFGGFIGDQRFNYYKKGKKKAKIIDIIEIDDEIGSAIGGGGSSVGEDEELIIETKGNKTFYKIIEKLPEPDAEQSEFNELKTSIDKTLLGLINPFTKELAKPDEYTICLSLIEKQKFVLNPVKYEVFMQSLDERHYFKINDSLQLKQVVQLLCKKQFPEFIELPDYRRFLVYMRKGGQLNESDIINEVNLS